MAVASGLGHYLDNSTGSALHLVQPKMSDSCAKDTPEMTIETAKEGLRGLFFE